MILFIFHVVFQSRISVFKNYDNWEGNAYNFMVERSSISFYEDIATIQEQIKQYCKSYKVNRWKGTTLTFQNPVRWTE